MFEFASASGTGPEAAVDTPSPVEEAPDTGLDTDGEEVVTEVEVDDEEAPTEQGEPEESEDKPSEPKDTKASIDKRILELAKKKGVDPNDPVWRETLREIAVLEKRREDNEAYVKDLKKELDWETPWEKEQKAAKKQPAAPQPTVAPTPQPVAAASTQSIPAPAGMRPFVQVDPNTRQIVFGDRFDGKTAKDAYEALSQAWTAITDAEEKGVPAAAMEHLYGEIHQIEDAKFRRHALQLFPHFDQMIEQRMEARLAKFREESGLAEIAPAIRNSHKQNSAAKVYEAVQNDIIANAELAPLFHEINTPPTDGSTVKLKGQSVPATPLNLALASEPELLEQLIELETDPSTSEAAMRKAILRTYKMVMRQAHNRQVQMEKSKALVKQATTAGREQAERTAEKTVVRQEVQATNGTPAPTRKGRSLLNPVGPGLSINALEF